uniref:Uncharacterized protein n=1 Tax=Magallana gigas TaxID=29159 RepID=K1QLT8_MAGGI
MRSLKGDTGLAHNTTLSRYLENAGLYCLSCTNSVSPRHCHTVRKCSEEEVCFTESHLSENGIVVFDSGCGSFQACHSNRNTSDSQKRQHGVDPHYQHSRCLECCSSDICNNKGCGQYGYPSARGPVCFDCPQVSDPALCDTIKVCDQNQPWNGVSSFVYAKYSRSYGAFKDLHYYL